MTRTRARALPETCCARLWLWPGTALYAGPSLRLDTHSGSVSCLAVGADAPFTIRTARHGEREVRSALIGPRLPHRLVAHGERMVFCYLDPASARERACRARMRHRDGDLAHHHADEAALASGPDDAAAERWLDLACPRPEPMPDERIAVATTRLREHPASSAAELAAAAGLSVSRFLHLFRACTGTSVRRYRLWARMLLAGTLIAEGHDLTAASAGAGFASPSHFSDSFRAMFGLAPSTLLGTGVEIRPG
ncbi:AraC family transcriptional regulator [Prauserella sp. PE36]|uniref:AraC family transcriptional regulator n=1 Tax=Prauserella endophytica TaxID=1592324 RepID=A0ABY2S8Q4_9PSEU|nr:MULTISPECIES: helix-turn-helix domain-containing protein [Prauserella]PXY30251.1 DNA-binding protein [Prauserella coralliicola]RBM22708.1 AraC family transcriptional regulator [Prauserella sp. PE36]TKG72063.1 AraC family transcriptional regulator [Prauserella endophytica]